jgi:hypothetical protein
MKKILISIGISAFGLVLATSTAFAAIVVNGNGANSMNSVFQHNSTHTNTTQTNAAGISNYVTTGSKIGTGNHANLNIGGTFIQIGGTTSTTLGVNNLANTNTSTSNNSCCPCSLATGDLSVTGNGDGSVNALWASTHCSTYVGQANVANISNNIHVGNGTGGNSANGNIDSLVTQTSGDTTTDVTVNNVVNSNVSN